VALTLILLVARDARKEFHRLLRIDPGFRTESAVAMELSLPNPRMDEQRYQNSCSRTSAYGAGRRS